MDQPPSDKELDNISSLLDDFITELRNQNFQKETLQLLCIEYILLNPREYITRDAEHILSSNVQDNIRKIAYSKEMKKKWYNDPDSFKIKNPYIHYSQNGFLSERIALAQVLLLKACTIAEYNEEKLQSTSQEQEIFNGMLPQQQEEIKPYIKKSFWQELYELCCT